MVYFKNFDFNLSKKVFKKYTNLGQRPKGAFNCNMFSCGGRALRGGMPSGYITFLTMLFYIFYLNIHQQHNINNHYINVFIGILISTAIGRYISGCHTFFQIIAGFFSGFIIGYIAYIGQQLFKKNKRFKNDKKKFYEKHIYFFNLEKK